MPHANTAEDHARRPRGSGTPGCSRMVASRRRPAPPPLRVSTCQIPSRASHYDLHDGPVCLCLAAAPWRASLSCCQGAEERGAGIGTSEAWWLHAHLHAAWTGDGNSRLHALLAESGEHHKVSMISIDYSRITLKRIVHSCSPHRYALAARA
jgi:hypothetical protein